MTEDKTDSCSHSRKGEICQGGLIDLCAYGASDIYLIGNPQNGQPMYGYSSKRTLSQNIPTSSLEFIWLESANEDKRHSSKAKMEYSEFFKPVDPEDKEFFNKIPLVYKRSSLKYKSFTDNKFAKILTNELDGEPIETQPEHYKKKGESGLEFVYHDYDTLLQQLNI